MDAAQRLAEMLEYQTQILDADGTIALAAQLSAEAKQLRLLADIEQVSPASSQQHLHAPQGYN